MQKLNDTILVVDDEPFNLSWLVEYIENRNYKIIQKYDTASGFEALENTVYRAVVVDLNIPITQRLVANLKKMGPLYVQYPGLALAEYARNHFHRGPQVIIYSVHEDRGIEEIAEKLRCIYLVKGRPRSFKDALDDVLSYDPSNKNKKGKAKKRKKQMKTNTRK